MSDNTEQGETTTTPSTSGGAPQVFPEYIPGSRRSSADYEAALRKVIDGHYTNVEPLRGGFTSLVRVVMSVPPE